MQTALAEEGFSPTLDISEHSRPPKPRPGLELALAGLVVLMFPASMSTVFGSLGAYVSTLVTILAITGILRVKPSFQEFRSLFPFFIVALIVLSTGTAATMRTYDWSYLRGTPVQWSAFLSVTMLAGLWQLRCGEPVRWAYGMLWASSVVSLIAIGEYAVKDYVGLDRAYSWLTGLRFDDSAYHRSADSFRAIGTMGNPLALGTLGAVAGAGALGFYLRDARIVWPLLLSINAVAAFASLSRSSWLALIASTVITVTVYSLRRGPSWLPIILHVLAGTGIVAAVLLYPPWQDRIMSRIEESYAVAVSRVTELQDSFSYSHRTSAMSDAVDSMLDNPLTLVVGYGLGAENSFFLGNDATPITGVASKDVMFARTFDNSFVTIAYSFGAMGLFWFAHLLFCSFRCAIGAWVSVPWYVGMLTAAIVCIYFYNAISTPSASYILAVLLGFRFTPDWQDHDAVA